MSAVLLPRDSPPRAPKSVAQCIALQPARTGNSGAKSDAVEPGDRRQPVVEVELGEAIAVAQRLDALAVQLVGEIHHAFASIVEFQPDLVVTEVPRFDDMPRYVLVSGQLRPPFAVD